MREPTQVNIYGIKCDAPGCGYTNMNAEFGNGKKWLNVPCPRCGAPLLTRRDYNAIRIVLWLSRLVNKVFGKVPNNSKLTHVPLTLKGDGTVDIGEAYEQDEFCVECGMCVMHCLCSDDDFNPTTEDIKGWKCAACERAKELS